MDIQPITLTTLKFKKNVRHVRFKELKINNIDNKDYICYLSVGELVLKKFYIEDFFLERRSGRNFFKLDLKHNIPVKLLYSSEVCLYFSSENNMTCECESVFFSGDPLSEEITEMDVFLYDKKWRIANGNLLCLV